MPTASLLATKGFMVHGVDVNQNLIKMIQQGQISIQEPDLDILVKSAVHSGNLQVSTEPNPADIFIIAVPTPFKENHQPDCSFIESAVKSITPFLNPGNLVILESTSPVGTTQKIGDWIAALRPDLVIPECQRENNPIPERIVDIYLAHCPERVLPGQILKELVDNDRVIGGLDEVSAEKAAAFYRKFVNGHIFLTSARTAELSKLVENAYRDVNIAFANELSLVCDKLNINVWELIKLANRHPRVNILQPGPGVGGHCIAVDPWFIVDAFPEEARLIKTAREVNDNKPYYLVNKILQTASSFKEPAIACLGLTFKANIADIRESPALKITKELAAKTTGKIFVVEPYIACLPEMLDKYKQRVSLVELNEALANANIVVLLVDHREFHNVNHKLLTGKTIFDTRGIWQ